MRKVGLIQIIVNAANNPENIHNGKVNWDWVSADVYLLDKVHNLNHDYEVLDHTINTYAEAYEQTA